MTDIAPTDLPACMLRSYKMPMLWLGRGSVKLIARSDEMIVLQVAKAKRSKEKKREE